MENSQRPIVKIIKEICSEDEITYKSFSYDWIFRLSKNGKAVHIFGYQFENNSATSQLICADKCATSDLLLFNGIPAVEHTFFMSPININYVGVSGNWGKIIELLNNQLNNHGRLVCKTNEGSGGSNVYLISNQFELERAVHKIFSHSRTMAVCPFYEIEDEFRVVVLNDEVELTYSKNIPFVEGDGVSTLRQLLISYAQTHTDCTLDFNVPDDDNLTILNNGEKYYLKWKHNIGQGAIPLIIQDKNLITHLSNLALQATKAVNIHFVSVDIIKTEGKYLVLEINSGVMMDHFSQVDDCNYQKAKDIYRKAIKSMF